jgi:hypothetical protein
MEMVDLLEFRVSKLVRRSDHCRHLADGLLPPAVNAAITAVADEYDKEAARMERECHGKRCCPCHRFTSCLAVD